MKVNMTPNPLDVVTIHASQGDTEARQWEFELHNNGELIDTSEITEQLFFKAYKGGTEQILPENTSTPTTSPFLGDIKYPQGLLSDQEYLYRESPTEEDGYAKITDIKGNTLVWNQLIQNGNFADTSKWTKGNGASSLAISNNEAVITIGREWNNDIRQNQGISIIRGHKYFASFEAKATVPITVALSTINASPDTVFATLTNLQTTFKKITSIATARSNADSFRMVLTENGSSYVGEIFTVRNVQIIDLTKMGLDYITDPSDFTSLFPLSYYSYNQGTLLSFNGNGIKTVGFNQWDEEWESGRINTDGTKAPSSTYIRSKNYIHIFPNTTYYRKSPNNIQPFYYDGNMNFISYGLWGANSTFVTPNNAEYMLFHIDPAYGTTYKNDICINISSSRNGEYEPYKESALSLPISTYFSNGMKSAGSVYDELTPAKAITRIGAVDLGSLRWTYANNCFVGTLPSESYRFASDVGATSIYQFVGTVPNGSSDMGNKADKTFALFYNSANTTPRVIYVKDSSYTDATVFKQALTDQNVKLYYELATPTETSFTTASLVTENAEIPLSNEDGILIGKCTEQLSSESGFFDAKIKLTDEDGDCYSNKLQLHIERSPQ